MVALAAVRGVRPSAQLLVAPSRSQLRRDTSSLLTDVPSAPLWRRTVAEGLQLIWSVSRRVAVIRQHSICMQHVFAAFCQPAAPRSALHLTISLLRVPSGRHSRSVQQPLQKCGACRCECLSRWYDACIHRTACSSDHPITVTHSRPDPARALFQSEQSAANQGCNTPTSIIMLATSCSTAKPFNALRVLS